jgi:hypothetical protein
MKADRPRGSRTKLGDDENQFGATKAVPMILQWTFGAIGHHGAMLMEINKTELKQTRKVIAQIVQHGG